MANSRKEQILSLLENDPNDTFLRYGLAMELRKEGSHAEAREQFESLMRGTPPYVAAWFMCGQMLAEMGEIEESRSVLREGVEIARQQGDAHAAGEMAELLASLGSLGE
ncbi:tetratricopeptide repeat protein [Bremerella cremea]|uniref:Tetratricopeptide repeat protein n=1 Tax=Bremerella cremea TaxID=1031537 RepID=A0A368KXN2_9BACT|nr:tetratricopeptide repeat protein [Bremerella cremea]RCS56018.1 tetratricopeptide repeat protein [Bremerella cremea]